MHFTDQHFGKVLMHHEVEATKPVLTRTSSVRDLIVGLRQRFGFGLLSSKQRLGRWLIVRGEKLAKSNPKLV